MKQIKKSEVLFWEENTVVISPVLAKYFGLPKAVLLQKFHDSIARSEHDFDPEQHKKVDDKTWVRQTMNELTEDSIHTQSKRTVQKNINDLEADRFLVSEKFNLKEYNHTKWYTLNYGAIENVCPGAFEPVEIID